MTARSGPGDFEDCARGRLTKGQVGRLIFCSISLVGGPRYFVTVKFDNDSSLLQACFVGVDFLSRF
jgi:hypothetical protein